MALISPRVLCMRPQAASVCGLKLLVYEDTKNSVKQVCVAHASVRPAKHMYVYTHTHTHRHTDRHTHRHRHRNRHTHTNEHTHTYTHVVLENKILVRLLTCIKYE